MTRVLPVMTVSTNVLEMETASEKSASAIPAGGPLRMVDFMTTGQRNLRAPAMLEERRFFRVLVG